jgi:hypothetical protein
LFVQLGAWGRRHLPVEPELAVRAELLEKGGPAMWDAFMDELRAEHLGATLPAGHKSVANRLQQAFEDASRSKATGESA